jgi:hypothetical protein
VIANELSQPILCNNHGIAWDFVQTHFAVEVKAAQEARGGRLPIPSKPGYTELSNIA